MKKSFIRAVMKSGKALTFESSWEVEVIFIFHNFYHSAKARIYPKSSYSLPDSWKNEIFPQFVDPEGIIVRFDLIAGRPLPYTINSMWFEMDSEGRNHLKSARPVELVYQFTGIKHSTRFPGEYEVIAVDKSHPSFHMGVNGLKQLESLKWKLELQNINHVEFREPDMNNELTAIASDEGCRMFKRLNLL